MQKKLKPALSENSNFRTLAPPKVSFEFFPPKTDEAADQLWQVIKELESLKPEFVSVTYGAGGSTRERTHQTVKRIKTETSLKPAAHLTCIGASKEEIHEIAESYWDIGVKHIVALRGDPPKDSPHFTPHPDGYKYASELTEGLRKLHDFEISVACFPEGHPESGSIARDMDYLKQKVDAGATRAITQYFFDTDIYFRFMDEIEKANISIPIIPGIVLIGNYAQLIRFSKMCGATVPEWVHKLLKNLDESPEIRHTVSTMIAMEQCRILREAGVEQFHFYTLNRAPSVQAVCHVLGVRNE